jgi:DNA-binding CsgD family transcriptional regulator
MGKKYLSPDISEHVLENLVHPDSANTKLSRLEILTHRELGILQLIAEGRTNRSAAEYLNLSPKTVEKHRASLMSKLGLRNATELTMMAMAMGLVTRPMSIECLVCDVGTARLRGVSIAVQTQGADQSPSSTNAVPPGPANLTM